MIKRTGNLTKAALLTALAAVLVCVSSWLPTGRLALPALAALPTAAAVIECGVGWAAGHYIAVCFLAFLLSPDKTMPLWYAFLFGHYALFKHWIEALSAAILRWILKLTVCYGCMGLLYILFSAAFAAVLPRIPVYWLVPVLGAVFIVYDIAFTRLIGLYMRRVHRTIQ